MFNVSASFLKGAALGFVAGPVLGLSLGWLVVSGTATQMAEDHARTKLVAAFTPICEKRFNEDAAVVANREALLKLTSSYDIDNFLKKGGWTDVNGAPDGKVATACAALLKKKPA